MKLSLFLMLTLCAASIFAVESFPATLSETALLEILLSAATAGVFLLAYKIRSLQKEHDRILNENKEDAKILFLNSRYASMGETLGNIAHQWKQPLNAIGTIQNSIKAALIFQGEISKEKLLYSVETSFKLLHHLAETIDTFYSFLAQQHNEKRSFVIADVLETIRKITEYSFENSNITLNFELAANPTIQGNPNEFTHAMLNLILNAKDAFDSAKQSAPAIIVRVSGGEKTCTITVSDNAGGIRLKPIDMIFDLHITTKDEGSGLGLFMTKKIIEQRFGGTITVENTKDGASFTIELPYEKYGEYFADTVTQEEKLSLGRINQLTHKIIELEELEKTLKKWAEVFEHAQWGIVFGTVEDQTLGQMNPEFARMHGYTIQELNGKSIASVFAPECIDDLQLAIQTANEKGYYSFESVHIRKDGSRFPVTIELMAIKDDQGSVQYRIANVWDLTEKKAAEERLLLKKFALDHIKDAVFMIDENARFHYVNDGACNALGYTREEFGHMNVGDVDPDWPQERWPEHWEVLKKAGSLTMELRHRRKDGTLFPVEVSANYIEFNGHHYNMAIARDITERRLLEEEKKNRIIKTVAENSPDVIIRYDVEGRRIYANPKAAELLGVEIGKSPSETTPIIDKELYVSELKKVIKTGIEATFEITYINAAGGIDYSHIRMVPEFGDSGNISSVLMIGRNITDQKLAFDALAQKERELRALAESSPGMMGTFYLRPDNSVCMPYVSPNIFDLFGLTPHDVAEDVSPLMALNHPDDAQRVSESIAESARTMSVWHEEYRIIHPTKGERWMESNTKPELHPKGGIIWYGYVHDITERKRSEEALKKALEFNEGIIAAIPDLLFEVAPDGTYVGVWAQNPELLAAQKVLLMGKNFKEVLPPDVVITSIQAMKEVDETGYSLGKTYSLDLPEGKRWFELSVTKKKSSGTYIALARDITGRKELEALLDKERKFLIDAQRVAHTGSWYLDLRTHVLSWSDETYRIFELDKGEIGDLHATFYERVHPEDREKVNAPYLESINTRVPYQVEHRIVMDDGRIKYVIERCEHTYGVDGTPLYSIGTVQDITERKKAEDALQSNRNLLYAILESSPGVITFALDTNYRYIAFDSKHAEVMRTIFGKEIAIGMNMLEVISNRADREIAKRSFDRALLGESFTAEEEYGDKRLSRHYWQIFYAPIYSESGEIMGLTCFNMDITERRAAEETIKNLNTTLEKRVMERTAQLQEAVTKLHKEITERIEAEKQLKLVDSAVNSTTEAIYINDHDLSILYVNDGACRMLGYTREELTSMKIVDIDANISAEQICEIRDEALGNNQTVFETKHRTKTGEIIDVEIVSNPFVYEGVEGAISVIKDITEKKMAQTELLEREEKFRQLFVLSPAAISITSLERNMYLEINDSFLNYTGYTREEVIGRSSADLGIFADPKERDELFRIIAQEGVVHDFRYHYRSKNGDIGYAAAYGSVIMYKGEKCYIGHSYDMSSYQQIEEMRRERLALEERLSKIAATVPGVNYIFEKTAQGIVRFTYLAPTFEELFGLSADAALGDFGAVMEHIQPEDREMIRQSIVDTARDFTNWHEEFRILHPTKGVVWIEGQSSPELQEDGSILWYGFFHDATERKNTQTALARSEETFRAIVENSPDVISRYDLSMRRTYVNPMMRFLLGKPLDEILGKTPREFSPLPEIETFEKSFDLVVREKHELEIEGPYLAPWGEKRWGNQRIVPTFDADGNVDSVIVIGRDATQQKRLEESLYLRERYQRTLLDNFPYFVWLKDRDSRLLAANEQYARVAKVLSTADLEGKTDFDFFPAELARKYVDDDRAVMREGKPKNVEEQYADEHDEIHWMETWKSPVWINGEIVGTVGCSRDITERKMMEKALQESEARYREIFENASDMIYLLKVLGEDRYRYLALNRAFEAIIGVVRDELIGQIAGQKLPPQSAKVMNDQYNRCVREAKIIEATSMLDVPAGRKTFRYTLIPVLNPEGDVYRIVALAKEIAADDA